MENRTARGDAQHTWCARTSQDSDWFLVGFAPRKQDLTLYIMAGFSRYEELMSKLGKHKTGKSCLYVKTLDDIHMPTLRQLITESVKRMKSSM